MKRTPKTVGLSGRQIETLRLIADGYSSKQIAGFLSIKMKTVEKHRQSLMKKLDIHQIARLTRYAVCAGVVEVNWPSLKGTQDYLPSRNGRANGRASGPRFGVRQLQPVLD